MNLPFRLSFLLAASALAAAFFAGCSRQGHDHAAHTTTTTLPALGELVAVNAMTDAAWLAKARTEYPINTCIVSKDALGSMGPAQDFIYKTAGKPDRLVRFCCADCKPDFLSNAESHFAAMAAAAAAKAASPATKP